MYICIKIEHNGYPTLEFLVFIIWFVFDRHFRYPNFSVLIETITRFGPWDELSKQWPRVQIVLQNFKLRKIQKRYIFVNDEKEAHFFLLN